MFKWLKKQPFAKSLTELQAQVDVFDQAYNTERGHQSPERRCTPQEAWDATAVAEPLAPGEWVKLSTTPSPTIAEPDHCILQEATGQSTATVTESRPETVKLSATLQVEQMKPIGSQLMRTNKTGACEWQASSFIWANCYVQQRSRSSGILRS